ncbi:uncharacterized protein [Haliotis cracherodii]|uniref:uncharacterized protein n=1 Tax=Haliotis cracherodii TaxID=6455 RepID=UPI0039ECE77F
MCGSSQTPSLSLSCRPTVTGITQIFALEIGKKAGAIKSAISRITVLASTVTIVDQTLKSRMTVTGSISGRSGSLDVTLTHLVDDDATTYYCNIAFLTDSVSTQETTENVSLHTLLGSVPKCDGTQVLAALNSHVPVNNSQAGNCPNGIAGRSEALMFNFCSSPDIAGWRAGPKVTDICCQIPKYTPVATFEFGFFVQDERGMAGVFMGCTDQGFELVTQLCGHPPINVSLTKSQNNGYVGNADNYHLIQFGSPSSTGNPFG